MKLPGPQEFAVGVAVAVALGYIIWRAWRATRARRRSADPCGPDCRCERVD